MRSPVRRRPAAAVGIVFCVLIGGGCGGGPTGPPPPTPSGAPAPTPTPAPAATPIACATPPPNPLPNPTPATAHIDSSPTGLCLRTGERATIEFTNRSNNQALTFSAFGFRDVSEGGTYTVVSNDCDQLAGKTLFPAALCKVTVQASCASRPSTAKLRVDSNAQNKPSYDVPVTCNP